MGKIQKHKKMMLFLSQIPKYKIVKSITNAKYIFIKAPKNFNFSLFKKHLKSHDLRVQCDLRNEKIGYKIRQATLRRIPFILVVGDKEIDADSVTVRTQDGTNLGSIDLDRVATTLPGLSSIR